MRWRRIRRRRMNPAQRHRHELCNRLACEAGVLELGISRTLERIWEPWELQICIRKLEEAMAIRLQIEKISNPKAKKKKRGNVQ